MMETRGYIDLYLPTVQRKLLRDRYTTNRKFDGVSHESCKQNPVHHRR